jgi:hypothetical protein
MVLSVREAHKVIQALTALEVSKVERVQLALMVQLELEAHKVQLV